MTHTAVDTVALALSLVFIALGLVALVEVVVAYFRTNRRAEWE